jgi:hypothetical protein
VICEPCKATEAPNCRELCEERDKKPDGCGCQHKAARQIKGPGGETYLAPLGVTGLDVMR